MPLRSHNWFLRGGQAGFKARSRMKNQGTPQQVFDGRPVIGICNTWSELTPCNAHLRILAEHIKRGVLEAGGFPLEFPVMSLGETLMGPTTMLYRNLVSMDVEESIRANPLDGVVLLDGAVIKPAAATPKLMNHHGRALVFKSLDDFHVRNDDPELDVCEDCVMVLQSVGPKGFPGMPEVGNMSLPRKLLDKGIRDLARWSDGRMSGTANCAARRLHFHETDAEMAIRRIHTARAVIRACFWITCRGRIQVSILTFLSAAPGQVTCMPPMRKPKTDKAADV